MATKLDQIRKRRMECWAEAERRWRARQADRLETVKSLRMGKEADSPERVLAFAQRESRRPGCNAGLRTIIRSAIEGPGSSADKVRVLERQIGPSLDWSVAPSGTGARDAGRSVGRICGSPDPVPAAGFATGFLVSPSLLLTNHHVFAEGEDAAQTYVQFGYEVESGAARPGVFFEIDPALYFTSNGALDFALVGVKPVSVDGGSRLADFRPNRLIAESGKTLIGHRISIIQYPEGGTKRYAERENELLDVLDDFLQYSTDTLPGSSGSPCFNESWEVVALHHSGIPRMKAGKILRVDGSPWDPSTSDSDIDWVANEGVRVSRIVAELHKLAPDEKQPLLDALFEGRSSVDPASAPRRESEAPAPRAAASSSPATARSAAAQPGESGPSTVIHVHGDATIYVGAGAGAGGEGARNVAASVLPEAVEKKLRFDPKYSTREGYQADFLGMNIPLPEVVPARRKELLKGPTNKILVLPYHHYSLAMNQERRFQMWSAVNADYSDAMRKFAQDRTAFGTDTWVLDPRIPANLQVQDSEFYKPATAVDRGHIVRREDNCWGHTRTQTEYANSDTFHWTNCTPQHERFNQSGLSGLWGQLENVVQEQAKAGVERVSIFAGPVLAADDPDAYGIQYPVRFWKVVAAVVDGRLKAYGFVLDQSPVIEQFGLEEIDFGKFTVYQHPLAQIEKLTGVRLANELRHADVLLGQEAIRIDRLDRVVHGEPA